MRRLVQGFFYNNPDNYPAIINSTRLLCSAGWEVELFCRDDGREWNITYPPGTAIERTKASKNGNTWQQYLGFVFRALSRGNKTASFFIGHDMHGFVPASLLSARHRRPLFYSCYDYADRDQPLNLGSRVVRSFQSRFARRADLVTVPDAGLGEIIKHDLRLKSDPLVIVNSPLEPARASGDLRKALRLRDRNFDKIVFRQGRVGPGHGIEATIRSMPFWNNRAWGFVVMGIPEPSFVEAMQILAASLGVLDRFVVLPPVCYDAVSRFTRDADLGHALYESIHVNNRNISGACKVQEYMAAGIPLLVSQQPSLSALAEKYRCGVVVDVISPERIAASVNSLLCDQHEQATKQMGDAGLRAFRDTLRFERQYEPVLRRMDKIVGRFEESKVAPEVALNS